MSHFVLDDFTQKQLQAVIDKMKACGSKKYPGQKEAKSEVENDGAIDDVMDKLKEVNTMLRFVVTLHLHEILKQ